MTAKTHLIEGTISFVKNTLKNAEGGHDWWHIYRVWNGAKLIAKTEPGDREIIELGALLHDIADSKFYNGDEEIGPYKARQFLTTKDVPESTIIHIENIISSISFKGGKNIQQFKSLELDVIQDADRLDAIGAIGIARTFNYGGYKNLQLYDPEIFPNLDMSVVEYKNNDAPTLNHFYEKLLLLKDRMNTKTGKKLAIQRHKFMEIFLEHFYQEWNGQI